MLAKTGPELYELQQDLAETENVIESHADVVKDLKQKLAEIVKNGRSTPGKPQANVGGTDYTKWHR